MSDQRFEEKIYKINKEPFGQDYQKLYKDVEESVIKILEDKTKKMEVIYDKNKI